MKTSDQPPSSPIIRDMYTDELRRHILTLDGRGVSFKTEALEELIRRAKTEAALKSS